MHPLGGRAPPAQVLSVKMYAKMKELGPIGGGVRPARPPPPDPPMLFNVLFLLLVPGPVNAFTVIRRGATHFELSWERPQQINGVLVGYSLAYEGKFIIYISTG